MSENRTDGFRSPEIQSVTRSPVRVCARPGCTVDISHRHALTKFCTEACRNLVHGKAKRRK